MNVIVEKIRSMREYKNIRAAMKEAKTRARKWPIEINGMCEGAADAFLAALTSDEKTDLPSLIVVSDDKTAARTCDALISLGLRAEVFPTREPVLHNMISSHETEQQRLSVLMKIQRGEVDSVISTCDAALSFTMPPKLLESHRITLEVGKETAFESLPGYLVLLGYVRADLVDGRGQFSVRGGILDIFPPQCDLPVRMEFFGDEIDQMGYFDIMTQRKTEQIKKVDVTPAREIILNEDSRGNVGEIIDDMMKRATGDAKAELAREKAAISDGEADVPFADKYISVIYPERACLLDYFDGETTVFALETTAIAERLKAVEWHLAESLKVLTEAGLFSKKCGGFMKDKSALDAFLESNNALLLNNFVSSSGYKLAGLFSLRTRTPPTTDSNFDALREDVRMNSLSGASTLILCRNETEVFSLSELLCADGIKATPYKNFGDIESIDGGAVAIAALSFFGFELISEKFICLSTGDGGERRRSQYRRKNKDGRTSKEKILSYADLEVGDYVVHTYHGIGKYLGIESVLAYDGTRSDHIKIQYAGTGVLYVSCDKIDNVSKYIGAHADDGTVKLSKLGGGEWERTKSRVRSEVKSMAKELISLYAERLRKPGFACLPDDDMQREFEQTFEFEETEGQLQAANEIKSDMEKPIPMDRLLCGDVGFGKTEVALRAAFKAVANGKQVAILVPTTILAMQHYRTILSRFRAFPIKVDMVSRFRTYTQQKATLRALSRGDVDIIVGTHRLLSDDVKFLDLGLLIVDEEQRFGVAHKEKLKQITKNVDVLTLTATPIPRTLNMAMSEIRDMSVLDEAPFDRLPVQTYVLEHDDVVIYEAIRRELRRAGQVFYLHNDIASIHSRAARIGEAFPEARVAVAHGQMDKDELSDIWQALVEGEIDILVCTTIIETGVDVPNANTLIIDNAQNMGLSQLHQIRGRVGRSARRAYAYFTFPRGKVLTDIQTRRLQAIRDFTEFGSGFKIAMRDLEIRGAGDLLGANQSGHMQSVGYDLYIKILNDAVLEERGEKIPEKKECTVSIGRDSYIPESYISSPSQRIDIYKKIAHIHSSDDVDDIADELLDRYGDLPQPVKTLMSVSLARALGSECGFRQIERQGQNVTIYPEILDVVSWSKVTAAFPGRITLMPSDKPRVVCKLKKDESPLDLAISAMKIYKNEK